MSAREERLKALRQSIPEVEPGEALELSQGQGVLIDVREPDEIAQGSPENAHHLGRGFLELRIEDIAPDPGRPVIFLCGTGTRSLFAADNARALGYRDVRSVAGGFERWQNAGLPFGVPRVLDADARARYRRQLTLPEVGEAGQARLADAKVLLIGAGGLGSPAALYLAAAGVGRLGIIDHDTVDRSNLHRQILHTDARVGRPKVESARETLLNLNPKVALQTYQQHLTSANAEDVFDGYDVVLDGSDNFPARYLVNDACVKLGLPNVHGSVFRFEGQASVFWSARPGGPAPCYRCLYPEPPPAGQAPSCNEAGVLGVIPGIIGLIQATETLKLLLNAGDSLAGRLLCFDALRMGFRTVRLAPDPNCPYCAPQTAFPGYVDYERFCNAAV